LTFNAASYNPRKLQLKPRVLQFLLQQPWRDQGSDLSPFPGKFDIAERSIWDRLSINTTIYEQGEILALLSDQDMQKIGVQLGVTADPGCAMPFNLRYERNACFANPLDVPATPTFISDSGPRHLDSSRI